MATKRGRNGDRQTGRGNPKVLDRRRKTREHNKETSCVVTHREVTYIDGRRQNPTS